MREAGASLRLGLRIIGVCAVVAMLLLVGAAQATPGRSRLYVARSGSNSAPGTARRPLQTIGAALSRARPGTTIFVHGGTYPERIDATQSGARGAPILVRAYPREHPIITGFLDIYGSYLSFSHLVFVGGTSANPDEVAVAIEGDDITLIHDEVRGASMSGVIVGDVSRANIIANWIHNNGTHVVNGIPQDQGLYLSGVRDGVIANNVIDHNLGFGIQLYPRPTRTLVTCNTIIANGATPNALASGIIVGGDETADNTIVNNIVAWNGDAGIRSLGDQGSGNVVVNNLGFGDRGGDFPAAESTGLVEHDNVTAPPRFVNNRLRNYRLVASSPAVGRALTAYAPPNDFDGRPRSPSGRTDIGAFQHRHN
jgi:parallel beta helix pectate lyase-like protein